MKIRIDKARKKAGQKSYALDARSLGLGQMYFDTFEQAEHEQQKILQDHNTILAESFSWNLANFQKILTNFYLEVISSMSTIA